MAVSNTVVYACDVPACPITVEQQQYVQPPGWMTVEIEAEEQDCSCECHTCAAGDEVELTGHDEDECPCQNNMSGSRLLCSNHTEEFKRRFL